MAKSGKTKRAAAANFDKLMARLLRSGLAAFGREPPRLPPAPVPLPPSTSFISLNLDRDELEATKRFFMTSRRGGAPPPPPPLPPLTPETDIRPIKPT